jgi:hypothetical protein
MCTVVRYLYHMMNREVRKADNWCADHKAVQTSGCVVTQNG